MSNYEIYAFFRQKKLIIMNKIILLLIQNLKSQFSKNINACVILFSLWDYIISGFDAQMMTGKRTLLNIGISVIKSLWFGVLFVITIILNFT